MALRSANQQCLPSNHPDLLQMHNMSILTLVSRSLYLFFLLCSSAQCKCFFFFFLKSFLTWNFPPPRVGKCFLLAPWTDLPFFSSVFSSRQNSLRVPQCLQEVEKSSHISISYPGMKGFLNFSFLSLQLYATLILLWILTQIFKI